jgi:tetratricopeptide (TPR) repeat protein
MARFERRSWDDPHVGLVTSLGAGRSTGRLRRLDETITSGSSSSEAVANALAEKFSTLHRLGRHDDAVEVCDEIVDRYVDDASPALVAAAAEALFNKGVVIGENGDLMSSLDAHRDLRTRFGAAQDAQVRTYVARGWFNEASTLAELGRVADSIVAYRGLVEGMTDDANPDVQEQVAMALVNLGLAYADAGRRDDELATYAMTVDRFGDNNASFARKQVAVALHNRLHVLRMFGRTDEWETTNADFQRRFARDRDPAIRAIVASARENESAAP